MTFSDPSPSPADNPGAPAEGGAPGSGDAPAIEHPGAMERLERRWRAHGRVFRWTVRIIVGCVLFAALSAIVITQTGLGGKWLLPRLATAYNLRIESDQSWIGSDAQAVIDGARVVIPGVRGDAGKVLQAKRVEAQIDWSRLFGGVAAVRAVTIDSPRLRVSQDRQHGPFNIEAIVLPVGSGAPTLPEIFITNGTLEVAEHDAVTGESQVLREILFDGTLSPTARGDYLIRLRERDATGRQRPGGVMIDGVIDRPSADGRTGAVKMSIRNPPIGDWRPEQLPSRVREFVTSLAPTGRVSRINIRTEGGRVPSSPGEASSEASAGQSSGPMAELVLDNVGLTLPIEPQDAAGDKDARARLRGVTGTVRFDRAGVRAALTGLLNDLPYTIDMEYKGYSPESALVCRLACRDFVVERTPELLPFVPPEVRRRLNQFSSPTAVVSTQMTISRGEPVDGVPGEVQFEGELALKHGKAAFEDFPYEFDEISGRVRFSNEEILFEDVRGVAPSGALLRAEARIAPPTDEAAANIRIRVTGAPIDEKLAKALGPKRGKILDELFDRGAYQRLVDSGTIGRDAEGLGGVVNADVRISTAFGKNQPWTTQLDLVFPTLAIAPRACPYPLVGRDIRVSVLNNRVTLPDAEFDGVLGGNARLAGVFLLPSEASGDQPAASGGMSLAAHLDGIEIATLLAMPPSALGPEATDRLGTLSKAIKSGGRLSGTIALVADEPEPSVRDIHADLAVEGGTVERADAGGGAAGESMALRGLNAEILLKDGVLTAHGDGQFVPGSGTVGAQAGDAGHLVIDAEVDIDGAAAGAVSLDVQGLDLATPIESLIAAIEPEAGADLVRARTELSPAGRIDASLEWPIGSGEQPARLELLRADGVSFEAPGGRVSLSEIKGGVAVEFGAAGPNAVFDGFSAALAQAGRGSGRVTLSGEHALAEPAPGATPTPNSPRPAPSSGLAVSLEGLVLESQTVAGLVKRLLGDESASAWTELNPRGSVGGALRIARDGTVSGEIVPERLTIRRGGQDVTFERLAGSIEVTRTGGIIRGLRVRSDGWSLAIDGAWLSGESGGATNGKSRGWEFRGQIGIEADSYLSSLAAALPVEIREILDDLALRVDGPMSLDQGELVISQNEAGERTIEWSGAGDVQSASGRAGVDFSRLAGRFECSARVTPGATTSFDLRIAGQIAVIEGASVSDLRVRVQRAPGEEEIRVPVIEATCHAGRAAGSAMLRPGPDGLYYTADVRLAGVRLSPLLDELGPPPEGKSTAAGAPDRALSRGLLDSEFTLDGFAPSKKNAPGILAERRGRGSLRIAGGRVLDLPLVLPLIRVSNLQLPNDEPLDYAQARFFIVDDILWFEDLSVFSRALAIEGIGTMTIPDKRLELRFDSRATRRIPIINWLVESIRDQLVTTAVRGPISDPEITLVQFPTARRAFDDAMGRPTSDRQRRLDRLDRYSNQSRDRLRPIDSAEPVSVASPGEEP